jgi:hypothetical protein
MRRAAAILGLLAVVLAPCGFLYQSGTATYPTASPTFAATPFFTGALTTAQTVKASQANLYGVWVYNPNASTCFLQVFNAASGSVTLGTTTPIFSFAVPNGPSAAISAPGSLAMANFATALSIAATTTATGASTCPTGMVVNLFYA